MLFSYIVGHVPVNFRKKIFINEKIIKKTQNIRYFLNTLHSYRSRHPCLEAHCDIFVNGMVVAIVDLDF